MLSKTALVNARAAIELLYTGLCIVQTYEKTKRENGSTRFTEVTKYDEEPCRISFSDSTIIATQENLAGLKGQRVKLFIAPELDIPPGCKITVTQDDITVTYAASSECAHYPTHQEIELKLFEKWA